MLAGRHSKGQKSRIAAMTRPAFVSGHLYLGTTSHALDMSQLSAFHVTHVLNCATVDCSLSASAVGKSVTYRRLGDVQQRDLVLEGRKAEASSTVLDGDIEMATTTHSDFVADDDVRRLKIGGGGDAWLSVVMQEAVSFIEDARVSGGRVLVCCLSGVNRGPAITIAYLMCINRMTLLRAIRKVQQCACGVVTQLEGYVSQLVDYAVKENLLDEGVGIGSLASIDANDDDDDDVDSELASEVPSEIESILDDTLLYDDAAHQHLDINAWSSSSSDDDESSDAATAGSDTDVASQYEHDDTDGVTGDITGDVTGDVTGVGVDIGTRVKSKVARKRQRKLPHARAVRREDLLV